MAAIGESGSVKELPDEVDFTSSVHRKAIMKVYIVIHHEIFQLGENEYFADPMVFHIASSLPRALVYIKETHVNLYSWWEVQEQVVDAGEDWPSHIGWYGRRAGKLRLPPFGKAVQAFKKCRDNPTHHLNA